jgi:hypothetical protein
MTVRSLAGRVTLSLAVLLTIGASVALFVVSPRADTATRSWAKFDQKGNLLRPDGWRNWVYIGTPLTPNELNPPEAPFPEFHNVYIDPDSYAHFEKTGKLREGTILVKELVGVGSKAAASGTGYFMGEFIGLEATVKSAKRLTKEPGNWGYFTFSHAVPPYPATAALQPTASCNACHGQNAAYDWVFTQYYPVLRAAKAK